MLKLKNVSKNFNRTTAVKDLTFELKKGEVAGLLGPNGAGKTTTMRMITSYYFPTKGNIYVDGEDTQIYTQKTQSKIGYLPENNPLYIDMIVVDFLVMSAKLHGIKAVRVVQALKKAAAEVDITDKLTSKISELSKGYKQRVGLAAALIHNPKILVLDEPTEGLDPNQRQEIRHLIKNLSQEKLILISTHVMQEVKAMCTRVILINNGELIKDGSPDSLSGQKSILLKIEGSKIAEKLKVLTKDDKSVKINVEDSKSKVKNVRVTSKKELRSEISKIAQENAWTIWEISIEDSLEEMFRELKE